ncbi:tRNA 4-thiouridine(8) synthase ThiI [Deltaproteobacteria bacterium]|nr:tRNA 4-thiouridine(8) synthase ThiI [Deltaproteobacteria bacterium]
MKALSVFSGGLDSMLASELIRALDIEVQALFFETPFFSAVKARESAESINLPLRVIDITERHLDVVRKPKHGYGNNMNPCIDCHALMFRMAGEMMGDEEANFIITGEVLGQRPMSQNRKSLATIDSESGIEGLVLRPLSAKLLSPTIPETNGWVDREKLLDYSGRSRKPQMALAKRLNISKYPSPAGGCLLTDRIFSKRLKDLLSSDPLSDLREIELLKLGRHFRIGPKTKVIVGRNKPENDTIGLLAREDDLLLNTVSVPGPTVLVIGEITPMANDLAAAMTASYSDAHDNEVEISLNIKGKDDMLTAKGRDKKAFIEYMI